MVSVIETVSLIDETVSVTELMTAVSYYHRSTNRDNLRDDSEGDLDRYEVPCP